MKNDSDFEGKVAVVTGAGGGMGLEISNSLVSRGAAVVMLDLKDQPPLVKAKKNRCLYCQGDLTDEEFVIHSIATGSQKFNRIDYLVNAAGILLFGDDRSIMEIDFATWDRVFEVNLKASAYVARACIPHMLAGDGGAMVHISTIQCFRGDDKPQDAYQASKAGLVALSKSLAIQFAGQGIRSNIIAPGMIDTPLQARWNKDPALKQRITDSIPLKRLGTAADIANACLFLLSDHAGYITGTEVIVDGGLLAKP